MKLNPWPKLTSSSSGYHPVWQKLKSCANQLFEGQYQKDVTEARDKETAIAAEDTRRHVQDGASLVHNFYENMSENVHVSDRKQKDNSKTVYCIPIPLVFASCIIIINGEKG